MGLHFSLALSVRVALESQPHRFLVGRASGRAVVFVVLERGCAWDAAFASRLPRSGSAVLVDLDVLDSLPHVGDLLSDHKGVV